ncbi:unnamed protein product [Lepeophtheirus salmonis]|uniref:(salmon louse) hypothetical protein n=1 Tax=Lepeophtheirus salmonis TaxID=72036 RepID=A0A7R8H6Q9_LEPSM|nr:unnamed protein product [Lepeophtheirus salmonis]CAF2893761.1 unnamed protein product [Lepeophtheirus salmonis]
MSLHISGWNNTVNVIFNFKSKTMNNDGGEMRFLETEDDLDFSIYETPKRWTSCKLISLVCTKSMILDFLSPFSDTIVDRDSIPKVAELDRLHNKAKFLVDAMKLDYTYKNLMENLVCSTDNRMCMMHRYDSYPGSDALRELFDQELEDFNAYTEFHYSQWQTTDQATLAPSSRHTMSRNNC